MAGLDRERILAKLDELDGYLSELQQIMPQSFEEYLRIEKRRACERLLQVSIEAVIDVCNLLVSGLRLGLPAEEDDLFDKLVEAGVFPREMGDRLRKMKAFRNILVHEYARVDDNIVYHVLREELDDFGRFKDQVQSFLRARA